MADMTSQATVRSCLACKQRKVKCDRQRPCSNCTRFNESCSFPRTPIRRHRPSGKNVDCRIQAMEKEIARLRGFQETATTCMSTPRPEARKGYLVVDKGGQSRLLAENAWVIMEEDETSFSRTLFDGLDGRSTPWYSTVQQQRADYSRLDLWTPTPSQLELCWHIYVENVDPIVRILHKPSVRTMLLASQQKKFDELDTGSCALLLAICFAAVNSLDMPRCRALFEEDGLRMKLRCKRSAELAIAQARLVQTHNFQVLQAFTLYLACAPRNGSCSTWTLIGLAIRIATSLGLHQDGIDFGLSPFEIEMRRRLWWELRMLDFRASEDCGTAICTIESNTQLPLNISDSDLDMSADHPPKEHDGVSEMSYSLLRYEILSAMSLVMNSRQARCDPLSDPIQTREQAITEVCIHIQRKYIQHLDSNNSSSIFRLFAEAGRLALAKIRLQAHYVFLQRIAPWPCDLVYPQAGPLLEELFQSSIMIMENYTRLALDRGLEPWRWHIRQYMQWHALSFVMSQLRLRTDMLIKERANLSLSMALLPEPLQRAWHVIELVFSQQCDHGHCSYGDNSNQMRNSGPWRLLQRVRQRIRIKLDPAATADGLHLPSDEEDFATHQPGLERMEPGEEPLGPNSDLEDLMAFGLLEGPNFDHSPGSSNDIPSFPFDVLI